MNILCTICSDLISQAESSYVTKCGHIFHHHCLAQWIERSKSCPQCRNKVTDRCMFRLYPTVSNEGSREDVPTLQSRLDDLALQLREQKASNKSKDDKLEALMADMKNTTELLRSYEKKLVNRDSAVTALKEQLNYLKIQNKETNKLKEENQTLHKNLQILDGLQKVLNATADEVDRMLQSYTDLRTIALFATSLKRALVDCEARKNEYRNELHETKRQLSVEKTMVGQLRVQIAQLENHLSVLTNKYETMMKRKAPDTTELCVKEMVAKIAKYPAGPSRPELDESVGLNTGMDEHKLNASMTRMEPADSPDSPYLRLKQGYPALSLLHRRENTHYEHKIKPSELAVINAARKQFDTSNPLSIFHQKPPLTSDTREAEQLGYFFDGLGGRSKVDTFPSPKRTPAYIPKLSAKHRLKRPAAAPAGSQDIGKLFQKLTEDKAK